MLVCVVAYTQRLHINNIALQNNLVQIKYEVNDTVPDRQYTIRVYSSHDNYLNPLDQVSGDVGHEVLPGGERTLLWDALTELGSHYDGSVALEIRARVYVPFINIPWFDDVKAIKKKREYTITWAGGRSGNVLNFDLYNRKDEKVATIANVANVGHYNLMIPSEVKPGKGYRFKISDSRNDDEVVFTPRFVIKRKLPLAISVLVPAIAITAGTYGANQLFPSESDDSIPGPGTDNLTDDQP